MNKQVTKLLQSKKSSSADAWTVTTQCGRMNRHHPVRTHEPSQPSADAWTVTTQCGRMNRHHPVRTHKPPSPSADA